MPMKCWAPEAVGCGAPSSLEMATTVLPLVARAAPGQRIVADSEEGDLGEGAEAHGWGGGSIGHGQVQIRPC